MSVLATFFSLDFVQRALLVGSLISLCAALLGVPLVLKRYSMIGDGLSHVGFASLAIAAALNATDAALYISIPVVVLAAFLLLRISESSHVKGDAAIGVIATLALAIGYIVMYRAGTNIDVSNYMFGNIFTIRTADAWLSIGIAAAHEVEDARVLAVACLPSPLTKRFPAPSASKRGFVRRSSPCSPP